MSSPRLRDTLETVEHALEAAYTLAGGYLGVLKSAPTEYLQGFVDALQGATVALGLQFSSEQTTCYVCCTESFPNTFTFSDPAEGAFIPIHAMVQGYDGLLRWAYNSWLRRSAMMLRSSGLP